MANKPKKQHYLAQFYLKGFCTFYNHNNVTKKKIKEKLWYYDVKRNEFRNQNILEVAAQNYFYSWTNEKGEKDFSVENSLQKFENQISPLINEINEFVIALRQRKDKTYNVTVNSNQRMWLLEFLRMMMVRVPALINTLNDGFINDMKESFPEILDFKEKSLKEDLLKTALNVGNYENKFTKIWFDREIWILFPSSPETSFITTDRPVVRFNKKGADGLAYDDTEVYLPLTQNCLLMVTSNESDVSKLRFSSLNDKGLIRKHNKQQASYATEIVIGRDNALLESLLKNLKFKPPPIWKDGHYIL